MHYRTHGDVTVSAVGVGSYALTGVYGPKDRAAFQDVVRRAYDLGITYFDTAAGYGDAEAVLGEAVRPFRSQVFLATKVGFGQGTEGNLGSQAVQRACQRSLQQLQTDCIDLYQVHFDDPHTPVEDTVSGLETLVQEGKIRRYGLCHLPPARVVAYCRTGRVFSVLMELSAAARRARDELLPLCREHGAAGIAFSVTGRGLLTGQYGQEPAFSPGDLRPGAWPREGSGFSPVIRYMPPFRDARFWYVQILVVLVASTHYLLESYLVDDHGMVPDLAGLHFVPVSLFLLPVVYAALNFGFAGAVATALWATLLTTPNILFLHSAVDRWGELFQLFLVNIIAPFVGKRVEMEHRARYEAEATGVALQASESRYRKLFETAGEAVLVLDREGVVLEINAAASRLFAVDPRKQVGTDLGALIGEEAAADLMAGGEGRPSRSELVLKPSPGREMHLQPVVTTFSDREGSRFIQIILRDVTEQRWQEAGLRTYAAEIVRAQEEERKRIAQELHDDAIQSTVLLYRALDDIEAAAQRTAPDLVHPVRDVRQAASELADSLRSFTRGLRPPILDDLGLVPAIRRVAAELSERTGVEVVFDVTGDLHRPSREAEVGLFRIVQEALRNVEHHARAGNVRVHLAFGEAGVELTVGDDGAGFRTPVPGQTSFAAAGRLGLLGMEERARLLGGALSIHSAPGTGTCVRVRVPLN